MKQPKYFEQSGTAFLFTKRLNSKHGTFPMFDSRIKKRMVATTLSEATVEAMTMSDDIAHLQQVSLKDSKNLPLSTRDMNRAAKTWLRFYPELDLERTKGLKGRHTLDAKEAKEELAFTMELVAEFFSMGQERHGPDGFTHDQWLTRFGDHLFAYLQEGEQSGSLLDAVPVYLKQTNRSHLPETSKVVRDAYRLVRLFLDIAGDSSLEQIKRRDVDCYVDTRLQSVKTTSVQREIATLRAIWHKAALVKDLRQANPFAETSIRGLGTDADQRVTPTIEQTRASLAMMEEKWSKKNSYVSPVIAIAALTGARLGEIWGLERTDWAEEVLLIRPNAVRTTLKTANSTRPFPVLPELQTWLERLFSVPKAASANSASAACNKTLDTLVVHGFRHGFKQRLMETDAPLTVIEELMGWSSQRMSSQYGQNTARTSKTRYVQSVYRDLFPRVSDNVVAFKR